MRNLRKLFAVVIAIALVLTSMTTAFAASTTYDFEAEAEVIKDLGIWNGNDNGDLMLGKELTRAEGAVLVLKAVLGKTEADQEDADTAILSDFVDADKVPGWAEGWVALAVEEGVIKGTDKGELKAGDPLKGKDLASMFMNALGYADENDYGTAVQCLADKSASDFVDSLIEDLTNAKLTRDAAAAIVFDAFTATAADAKVTLIEAIVGDDATLKAIAVDAGLIEEVVEVALDVVGASAANYKEIVVTFNKAGDAAKLGTVANYAVTGKTISSVKVADDNKSVTLLLADATIIAPSATAEVTVKAAILGADKKVTTNVVVDGALPAIVAARAIGNSKIEVEFSEPVKTIGSPADYKIDGLYFAQSALPSVDGRVLTLTPTARLAAGNHTISVASSITDYAGYGLTANRTADFTVDSDTVAPSGTFKSASQTQVVVTFSEPVVKASIESAAISFTNGVSKNTATLASDNVTLTVTVNGVIPASGVTTMTIAKSGIVDTFGNTPAADVVLTFTATADTARPEVVSVAFATDKQDELYVTFSKDVALDGTYTLTKTASDGTVTTPALAAVTHYIDTVPDPDVTVKSKVVVKLAAGSYDPTATYSLLVKGVTDAPNPLANKIVDYVATGLKVADLTAPVFQNIKVYGQSMYINFDSAVNASSVLATNFVYVKANNSIINGLPAGTTLELINSGKTIKITWKDAVADSTNGLDPDTIKQIQWAGLVGADGNTILAKVEVAPVATWDAPAVAPSMGAVEVTGSNTITVAIVNNADYIFDAGKALADFKLKTTTSGSAMNLINATYADGKITFTTYEKIEADGTYNSQSVTLYTVAANLMNQVDLFGQKFVPNAAGTAAADKIAPTATLTKANAADETIKVTLSEAISAPAGYESQFVVTVDGISKAYAVAIDATNKVLTFTVTGGFDASKAVSVKYFASGNDASLNLTDGAAGNKVANFDLSGTSVAN